MFLVVVHAIQDVNKCIGYKAMSGSTLGKFRVPMLKLKTARTLIFFCITSKAFVFSYIRAITGKYVVCTTYVSIDVTVFSDIRLRHYKILQRRHRGKPVTRSFIHFVCAVPVSTLLIQIIHLMNRTQWKVTNKHLLLLITIQSKFAKNLTVISILYTFPYI